MAFTIVQVEAATALDVGVSVGAAGVGAGLSAGIGSDGLSAGVSVDSKGSGTAASGSTGPSGVGGALGANAGAVGASAQGNLGSGGLGAAADVSSGSIGTSVSGTAGPSGLGGNAGSAGATANADIGGGQQGPSGGVGTNLGGNGTSAGVSTSSASPAASGSGFSGVGSLGAPEQERAARTTASIAPTALTTSSLAVVTLPETLWPLQNGANDGGWFRSIHWLKPLRAKLGTPMTVVQSCRTALVSGAWSYGAIQVDVASAGRIARLKDGSLSAPVEARIVFQRGDRVQVRQARITCRLDARGHIVRIY